MRIVLVDNHDSFTFNLFHLAASLPGVEVLVVPNDQRSLADLLALHPDAFLFSPGPGRPDRPADFGVCTDILHHWRGPLLGVCLGHQGLCHHFGATVSYTTPVHGYPDSIHHDSSPLFAGLPSPFHAIRYHSLHVAAPLPACLRRTAWNPDGLVMAVQHRELPFYGVQFHPESIATEHGAALIENFVRLARAHSSPAPIHTPQPIASPSVPAKPHHLHLRNLPARLDSAETFLRLFGQEETVLWLDNALPGAGRYSLCAGFPANGCEILSANAHTGAIEINDHGRHETLHANLFDYLHARLAAVPAPTLPPNAPPLPFHGGFLGILGYEAKTAAGYPTAQLSTLPDALFVRAHQAAIFDHHLQTLTLLYLAPPDHAAEAAAWFDQLERRLEHPFHPAPLPPPPTFTPRLTRDEYLARIAACLDAIAHGESYELCLTNQFTAHTGADPLSYYLALRRLSPAPHSAFLRLPGLALACASPERFLSVSPSGLLEARPIKGTLRRSTNEAADRAALANDPKVRAENLMIVDLLRHDLGRVAQPASVHVPGLMEIESYSTLHQMVSTIRASLRPGLHAVDALRAAFPGGSMTGAPKERSLSILDALEAAPRGLYSGSLGYLSYHGAADFNIVIRSTLFLNGLASIGAGGAIVAASDPSAEWDEILLKAHAPIAAFHP